MSFKTIIYKLFSCINYYYYPTTLTRETKTVLQDRYRVSFTPEEIDFLKKSAATFDYHTDYTDGYWQKALYTVRLAKVTLLGNSGALVKQNKVIAESTFDAGRLGISPAYRSPAVMWNRHKPGLYTSVFHLPWAETSNFHWFYDCLPRVYILLQQVKEPVKLIVNQNLPAFQLETLQFVITDYPHITVVYQPKTAKWEIEHFIFPGFVTNHSSGFLPARIAHFLREKIWQGYQVQPQNAKTRLYISRSKARKRRILNENMLTEELVKLGFIIVHAEDLTYAQQVQLFYNAAIIVAPHGAGLTNILFSKHCRVLELHPADIMKPHYFLAAKALSFDYFYEMGSKADANLDFTVNVEEILKKYKMLLST
ncbi:glycosyltransferase family 61 protein [Adhaeribacter pallidiroseus]|uniref:Glycosyltransferase 61 catalytic domain-containing protein n=1 Tax=Adhaeribacter pallidiroseus TaxID=2072847 RepID=A0A369QEL1_9BACT|nr:glycosyltransferase family 61 protein [Adhaeribacter pallidiroseus]RDC62015.1 hypothetical protein AHMF7616_00605 [Adhaeribacter pallidiroseus]